MCKLSPVFKQFAAIVCCKSHSNKVHSINKFMFHSLLNKIKKILFVEIGNLLTLSFGIVSGWATINFNELQSENSTFSTGPLKLEEASLVVSILNIGGLIGNFGVLPISQLIGVKRTLHILGPLLIVIHVNLKLKKCVPN